MSCWVVPQLAAELWSICVDQVLEHIRAGTVASMEMGGFTFVNTNGPRPATYVARPATYVAHPAQHPQATEGDEECWESADPEPEPRRDLSDWRASRVAAGLLRRGPGVVAGAGR